MDFGLITTAISTEHGARSRELAFATDFDKASSGKARLRLTKHGAGIYIYFFVPQSLSPSVPQSLSLSVSQSLSLSVS